MDETPGAQIEPDPTWSVCTACWAVVASAVGHAATHDPEPPPDTGEDDVPLQPPEEP